MQLACYAWRIDDRQWEGICTDLDIAAQGNSLDEVKRELDEAITAYLDYVFTLPEDEARHLLARKSPLLLRWRLKVNNRVSVLKRLCNRPPRFAEPWVVEAPAS